VKTLVAWLHRIETAAGDDLSIADFRIWIPGFVPLDLANWILDCEPRPTAVQPIEGSSPKAHSILRILDLTKYARNVNERHRLGSELGGLLTLALGRRVEIVHEVVIDVPQFGRALRMPFTHSVDRTVLGPVPPSPRARIEAVLATVLGLDDRDLTIISAASSVYNAAILLFDREVRAAYSLLILGIELLSREYGEPPKDWIGWDQATVWDDLLGKIGATPEQSDSIRSRLLQDKQLRLKATFRAYASSRLPSTFWSTAWEEWTWGISANDETWTDAAPDPKKTVADLFPEDREALSRALGKSYDLRSAFVHRGDWLELFQLSTRAQTPVDLDSPLPFSVLRAILGELILVEASERTTPAQLPDVQILRQDSGGA
jgi:hypothetical protein